MALIWVKLDYQYNDHFAKMVEVSRTDQWITYKPPGPYETNMHTYQSFGGHDFVVGTSEEGYRFWQGEGIGYRFEDSVRVMIRDEQLDYSGYYNPFVHGLYDSGLTSEDGNPPWHWIYATVAVAEVSDLPPSEPVQAIERIITGGVKPGFEYSDVIDYRWTQVYTLDNILFTGEDNVVNFNALTSQQISAASDLRGDTTGKLYKALGGNDNVALPSGSSFSAGDTLISFDHTKTFSGDEGADTIAGGASDNIIDGGGGNDLLKGEDGADQLSGGDGADTLNGDVGNDSLSGAQGADIINGGSGNDVISGAGPINGSPRDEGGNQLRGDEGQDTLYGWTVDNGSGAPVSQDSLWGGSEIDTFYVDTRPAEADLIMDFEMGESAYSASFSSPTKYLIYSSNEGTKVNFFEGTGGPKVNGFEFDTRILPQFLTVAAQGNLLSVKQEYTAAGMLAQATRLHDSMKPIFDAATSAIVEVVKKVAIDKGISYAVGKVFPLVTDLFVNNPAVNKAVVSVLDKWNDIFDRKFSLSEFDNVAKQIIENAAQLVGDMTIQQLKEPDKPVELTAFDIAKFITVPLQVISPAVRATVFVGDWGAIALTTAIDFKFAEEQAQLLLNLPDSAEGTLEPRVYENSSGKTSIIRRSDDATAALGSDGDRDIIYSAADILALPDNVEHATLLNPDRSASPAQNSRSAAAGEDAAANTEPAGATTLVGNALNNNLVGNSLNNVIRGGAGTDTIHGGMGDDQLQGDGGDDHLAGEGGNDTLAGGAGNDVMDGGEGVDTAVIARAPGKLLLRQVAQDYVIEDRDTGEILTLRSMEVLRIEDGDRHLSADQSGLIKVSTSSDAYLLLPDRYTGPVAGLEWQYLGSAAGDILGGTNGADFINALGGDDAVHGGAGDDVLDGGTGSNFLTGGTGQDVIFLDGRGGTTTWSTFTDWQAGEQLSVWGFRPGTSNVAWYASEGAEGYRGVTMHADLDGNGIIDTSVTWTGKQREDLPTPLQFDGLLWFV
jgi:Ca2+-binding RTX toxin-like protein